MTISISNHSLILTVMVSNLLHNSSTYPQIKGLINHFLSHIVRKFGSISSENYHLSNTIHISIYNLHSLTSISLAYIAKQSPAQLKIMFRPYIAYFVWKKIYIIPSSCPYQFLHLGEPRNPPIAKVNIHIDMLRYIGLHTTTRLRMYIYVSFVIVITTLLILYNKSR